MSTILNIIYFVLILGVIVLVHELGHLVAAKKFGVYCKEFSIGMGPVLWKKQGAETAEANMNAGLAAARQIVGFIQNGDVKFKVN